MAYNLIITYTDSKAKRRTLDVTTLSHNIEFTTSLESQAGRLTFNLEQDPNERLELTIGAYVEFFSDTQSIFFGKIFAIETDATDIYKVTAYDMLRYLKNEDSIIIDGSDREFTLAKLFRKLMGAYNLSCYVSNWWRQVNMTTLEEHNFTNETLFDILDYCMRTEETRQGVPDPLASNLTSSTNPEKLYRRFYLKCNHDVIELREIFYDFFYKEDGTVKDTFLMIGDESLLTDYEYKVDIDTDTYNRFLFVINKEADGSSESDSTNTQVDTKQLVAGIDAGYRISNTNTSLDGQSIGENTIDKWGILKKVVEIKTLEPLNKVEGYMKTVVEMYSQPNRTLKMNALGYDGVTAGTGFFLYLKKLGMSYPVYVLSATHRYDDGLHTMELEVSTNANMRKFL